MHLAGVLLQIEPDDSDGDTFSNLEEIELGSYPGAVDSTPAPPECPDEPIGPYDVCNWDARYVFSRVGTDFCGSRPTYEDLASFDSLDAAAKRTAVHEKLDACLASEFWRGRDGEVWQLAYRKIRPIGTLKALSDYDVDFGIFAWAHLDHHDVRDMLLSDLYTLVSPAGAGPTIYQQVATVEVCDPLGQNCVYPQPMQQERRVGMISTTWFLLYYVMFSPIPRTAAAQAYRSYLNFDIAKLEGLDPLAEPPVDYDGSGIEAEECAVCHATLEPLTAPFTRYNAFQDPGFTYDADRMNKWAAVLANPSLAQVPEAGRLLGQDVADLRAWAQVAANSDEFYAAVTEDYWQRLVGAKPSLDQSELYQDFDETWRTLKEDPQHSVFRMLHTLIDTEAYGAP